MARGATPDEIYVMRLGTNETRRGRGEGGRCIEIDDGFGEPPRETFAVGSIILIHVSLSFGSPLKIRVFE